MPGQQENEGTLGQNSPWFAFYLVISTFSVLTDYSFTSDGTGDDGNDDDDEEYFGDVLTACVEMSFPLRQLRLKTNDREPACHNPTTNLLSPPASVYQSCSFIPTAERVASGLLRVFSAPSGQSLESFFSWGGSERRVGQTRVQCVYTYLLLQDSRGGGKLIHHVSLNDLSSTPGSERQVRFNALIQGWSKLFHYRVIVIQNASSYPLILTSGVHYFISADKRV